MLRIGITGGIGSGKSTVARIFGVLGIPVYYADEASRKLMTDDPVLKKNIIESFGDESYLNGQLNRPYLAARVFGNREKLRLLNALVHPATLADASEWMKKQKTPYALKEAALIFESGSQAGLDYVIGVKSPEELRIKRAMVRDGISLAEVRSRMNLQMDEAEKMNRCDFIIINDEHEMLIPQVLALHDRFLHA